MLRPLRFLFGIYCGIIFLITLFIFPPGVAFIFLLASEKKAPHLAHRWNRNWARIFSFFFFQPVRLRNKEYIDPNRAYVFVANHRSQLDIPVFALACKNTFRFLAKAELTKIPLMGFVIKKLYITVNRKDHTDRNRSIEIMRRSLDEGISVFLCPEGTRNKEEEPPLLDFRDGAFRLAILTQMPLAVLTLINTADKLSPKRPVEMGIGAIYGVWDKPIETKGMTIEDVPALKEKVKEMMIGHLAARNKKA
jgi:1-acyl-sn-glycerol-3-phosphate acyltransferase